MELRHLRFFVAIVKEGSFTTSAATNRHGNTSSWLAINAAARLCRIMLIAALGLLPGAGTRAMAEPAALVVRYPNINGMGKQGLGYRMLDLALRSSGRPYRIALQAESVNQERVRAQLENDQVDIVDFGSSPEFERRYSAVYFPIDRGLNGWRLLVTRKEDRAAFSGVNTIGDLSRFVAGQGLGWPDADILRHAGLNVLTFPHLESLFRSLEGHRFDYLPLGMDEAYDLSRHYASGTEALCVNSRIVIIYPFGRLFFVRKQDAALHDLIDAGLRKAFANGLVQKLLATDPGYAEALRHGEPSLKLRVDNPGLTAAFRAIPSVYFLH